MEGLAVMVMVDSAVAGLEVMVVVVKAAKKDLVAGSVVMVVDTTAGLEVADLKDSLLIPESPQYGVATRVVPVDGGRLAAASAVLKDCKKVGAALDTDAATASADVVDDEVIEKATTTPP
jgi:hypothetical protein